MTTNITTTTFRGSACHAAGGAALVLALAITINREDIADAIFDEGLRGSFSGDTLGAVLWSTSLYFCSPWQTLLIFLGRVDTERPSDWTMNLLSKAAGIECALFSPSPQLETFSPGLLRLNTPPFSLLSGP